LCALRDKTVLVLGAGMNGVAITRELLLNGVPVCLVDRGDIAGGTTAYSSRLIHGGLRYLEYGEFQLVRESLEERERLLRLAPQFVRPLHLYIPIARRASGAYSAARKFLGWSAAGQDKYVPRGLWLVWLGLRLYDWCARHSSLPRHQVHRLTEPSVPPVDRERFRWLVSYYDAQIQFPERFVVAMLEDARRLSAEQGVPLDVHTYHRASKRGAMVTLQPMAAGEARTSVSSANATAMSFQPAAIVNATGAWVDQTLAQLRVASPQLVGGTKGSHFLTRNTRLRTTLADKGVYAEARDGRPVFLLPFGPYSLVGTTDLPVDTDTDPGSVTADDEELQYLLQAVHEVFPRIDLTRHDMDMHYCGVRPLPRTSSSQTASITRRHLLHTSDDPDVAIVSIIGGKLTTCRSLAEEAAELVLRRLGVPVRRNSRDRVIPGGEDFPGSPAEVAAEQSRLAEQLQFTTSQVAAVWQLCGTRTSPMLSPASPGEANGGGRKNLSDTDLPLRFVRRVLRDEWCCRLEDLVERRLMLLYGPDLSRACLRQLAELMAEQGLLARDGMDAAVAGCIERLRAHFGRAI
jgi:glycerol-3-phosphate dehydrogenase